MPASLSASAGSPVSPAASPDFRLIPSEPTGHLVAEAAAAARGSSEALANGGKPVGAVASYVPLSRWGPLVGAAGLLLRSSAEGKEPSPLEQRVARIVSNKRISELYLSWMPWQQSALLAGVLDRCPTDQLTMIYKAVGRPTLDPIEFAISGGSERAASRHWRDTQLLRVKRLQQELSLAIDTVFKHRKSWKQVYAQRQRKEIALAAEQSHTARTDMYRYVDPAKFSSRIEAALRKLLRQSGVTFTYSSATGPAGGAPPQLAVTSPSLAGADGELPLPSSMIVPRAKSEPAAALSASPDGEDKPAAAGATSHRASVSTPSDANSVHLLAAGSGSVQNGVDLNSTYELTSATAVPAASAAVVPPPLATYFGSSSNLDAGSQAAIGRPIPASLPATAPAENGTRVASITGDLPPEDCSSSRLGQAASRPVTCSAYTSAEPPSAIAAADDAAATVMASAATVSPTYSAEESRPGSSVSGFAGISHAAADGRDADRFTAVAAQPLAHLPVPHLRVNGRHFLMAADAVELENHIETTDSPRLLDASDNVSSVNNLWVENQQRLLEQQQQQCESDIGEQNRAVDLAAENDHDPTVGRISSNVMAVVIGRGCLQASDDVRISEIVAETLLTTAADVGLYDGASDQLSLSPAHARQIRERISGDVVQAVLKHHHIYVGPQEQLKAQQQHKQLKQQLQHRQQRRNSKSESGKHFGETSHSRRSLKSKPVHARHPTTIASDRPLLLHRVASRGGKNLEQPNLATSHFSHEHVTPATPEPSLTTIASSKHSVTTMDYFPERPLQRYGGLCRGVGSAASDTSTAMDVSIPLQAAYKSVKFSYGINEEFLVKPNRRKLAAVYQSQLQDIWQAIEKWRPSDIMTLVVDLVKVSSDDILATLRAQLSAKCRLARNVNDLPDRLLLRVFRFLKPDEIENARKVCQQWHYLCSRPELWMQKCDEIGWKLGVPRLSDKLRDEAEIADSAGATAVIDWKLCFYELERLARGRLSSAGVASGSGSPSPGSAASAAAAATKVAGASAKCKQRRQPHLSLAPAIITGATATLDASLAVAMAAVSAASAASAATSLADPAVEDDENTSREFVPLNKLANRQIAEVRATSGGREMEATVARRRRAARLRLTPVYIEPLSKSQAAPPSPSDEQAADAQKDFVPGTAVELRGDQTSKASRRSRRRGTDGSSPQRVTIAAMSRAAELREPTEKAEAEAELPVEDVGEELDREDEVEDLEQERELGERYTKEEPRRQLPQKSKSRLLTGRDASESAAAALRRDPTTVRRPTLAEDAYGNEPKAKTIGRSDINGDVRIDYDTVGKRALAEIRAAQMGATDTAVANTSAAAEEAYAEAAAAVDGAATASAEQPCARNSSSVSRIGIEVLAKKKIMLEADEVALDIRTALKPIRNLMPGFQGAERDTDSPVLEWGHPDTCNLRDPAILKRCKAIVKEVCCVRRFQGHLDSINCVAIDKRRAFTGSTDHVIFLWDLSSGELVRQLVGHTGSVRCLQLDAGRNVLYSGSWDESIIVWDVVKFKSTALLLGHEGVVTCLKLNADATILVSAATDSTVRVWSTITYNCQRLLTSLSSAAIGCLWFDGSLLAAGGDEGVLRVYDFAEQKLDREYTCTDVASDANRSDAQRLQPQLSAEASKPLAVTSVTIASDLVVAGLSSGELLCWDRLSAQLVARFALHRSSAIVATVFCYGRLLTAGSDGLVKEWEMGTMACVRVLRGHMSAIRAMEVREKDDRIVTVGDDKLVHVWDLRERSKQPLAAETTTTRKAAAGLSGPQRAVVSGEQAFQTWLPASAAADGRK